METSKSIYEKPCGISSCIWVFLHLLYFSSSTITQLRYYVELVTPARCDCVSLSRGLLWCWHCSGVNESLTPNLLPWGFSEQCVESSCRSMDLRRFLVVHVHWWRLNWDLAYRKLERNNSVVIQSHVLGCMDILWGNASFFNHLFRLHCIMSLYWRTWWLLCFVTCRGHHWVVIFTVFQMWDVQMHDRFPRTSIVVDSTFFVFCWFY